MFAKCEFDAFAECEAKVKNKEEVMFGEVTVEF